MLEYEGQSPDQLVHYLIDGDYDVSSLNVLKSSDHSCELGYFQIGILGASHFIKFGRSKNDILFTEIFACAEISSNKTISMTKCKSMNSEAFGLVSLNKDFWYDFECARYYPGDKQVKRLLDLADTSEKSRSSLVFKFPSSTKDFPTHTLVRVMDYDSEYITIRTTHCYEDQRCFVDTETEIRKGDE